MKPIIIAEISKTWQGGSSISGDQRPLCELFEDVINVNLEKGYALHSWKLDRQHYQVDGGHFINECIIAIFAHDPNVIELLADHQAAMGDESKARVRA